MCKYSKWIGVYLILSIFLIGAIPSAYAVSNMEEVQTLFRQETGKRWSKATNEERSNFIRNVRRREKEGRERRVKGVNVPFYVREGFRKEYQMSWEDATVEEQRLFIEEYQSRKELRNQEEIGKLEKEKLRSEEIKIKKSEAKKERDRKKKEREKRKKDKKDALRKKRKEEREKLKDSNRDNNELLKKLKDMRKDRSNKDR